MGMTTLHKALFGNEGRVRDLLGGRPVDEGSGGVGLLSAFDERTKGCRPRARSAEMHMVPCPPAADPNPGQRGFC